MAMALFADVHSNLEALLAVKQDIESVKPDEIWFLGDVVGYGPNPIECMDIVGSMADVQLMGNHDDVAAHLGLDPRWEGFRSMAAEAIKWTRKVLNEHKSQVGRDYFEFLKSLKNEVVMGKNHLVHGSPKKPFTLTQYILLNQEGKKDNDHSITCYRALELAAPGKERVFAAHAHQTWVHYQNIQDQACFMPDVWLPLGNNESIVLPKDEAAVIMIGSVGQPRDGDWRACWVLLDGDTVYFRRCEYDVEKTINKINQIPELDKRLGKRLREGM